MSNTITFNGQSYKLFKLLGKGSFGEVYLTQKVGFPELLATKVMNLNQNTSKKLLKYLNYELSIMKELNNHQNIIRFYDNFSSLHHCYVVMEYCNGGSLSESLKRYGKPFPQEIIQHFMRQIVEGLKYIHSKGIIHRDIKMDNILIKYKNEDDLKNFRLLKSEIKIIDFGLATKLGKDGYAYTFIGSPINMDPHMLEGCNENGKLEKLQKYNEKADIWSLGTICYQMLTGNTVFKVSNFKDLVHAAKLGIYHLPVKDDLTNEMISFIFTMLQYYGDCRKSAEQISAHPFLNKPVKEFVKVDLNKLNDKISNGYIVINSKSNGISSWDTGKVYISKNQQFDHGQGNHFPINNKETDLIDLENVERKIKEIENKEAQEKEIFKNKLENRLKSNPKKTFSNKNFEQWYNYLTEILEEYQEAKKYFVENNLITQEQNANKIYAEIQKLKTNIESGIQIQAAPSQVTPEFIYGYTTKERNERFIKIINKYLKDKNYLILKANSNKKHNIFKSIREEIENDELKIEKLDFIIKSLKERYNNVWIPAPEFIKESQSCKVRKVTFKNAVFIMKIVIKKMEKKVENINLKLNLKINELKQLYKEINLNNQDKSFEEWDWSLNFNDWKNVDNNTSNYILSINIINNNLNQNVELDIKKILNGKVFSSSILIPTANNDKEQINIKILPILPDGEKYFTNETKVNLVIKKIFPAFVGKSPLIKNDTKH